MNVFSSVCVLISLSNLKDIEGEAALAQSAGLARARSRAVAWEMSRVPKDLLKKDLPRKIAFRPSARLLKKGENDFEKI